MLSRIFNSDDQIAFAKLSGDCNELHLDAIAARRSLYGAPVVHGINALLWALDSWLPAHGEPCEIVKLKVLFTRQITVGEEVLVERIDSAPASVKLKLFAANTPVATIKVELRERNNSEKDVFSNGCPAVTQPVDMSRDELQTAQGDMELFLDVAFVKRLYPNLAARMNLTQVAAILGSTRIVGVFCPGKYSLYSELELTAIPGNGMRALRYKVASADERFGLLDIDLSAPNMSGVIRAFHRPRPQKQQDFASLRQLVNHDEFANQLALIVGGSRGLGEVAAKLLAAGGANVKITYHQGREEARAVVSEIISNGGIADSFQFDVLNPKMADEDVSLDCWFPTHLYYFATPLIFSGVKGKFSLPLFQQFCDFYVTGLIKTLNVLGLGQVNKIFCPSSIAVEDPPLNLGEYAAAKVAGEMLGTFLEKAHPGLNVYEPRLPRLATDQTSNVAAVESADPVPLLLVELRSFQQAES
jgi:hypothetical protein